MLKQSFIWDFDDWRPRFFFVGIGHLMSIKLSLLGPEAFMWNSIIWAWLHFIFWIEKLRRWEPVQWYKSVDKVISACLLPMGDNSWMSSGVIVYIFHWYLVAGWEIENTCWWLFVCVVLFVESGEAWCSRTLVFSTRGIMEWDRVESGERYLVESIIIFKWV